MVDREARDHLADREPRTVALGLQAHEPLADPGKRGEYDAVRDADGADPERLGERGLGHTARVGLRDRGRAAAPWVPRNDCQTGSMDEHVITTDEELGEIYGPPQERTRRKQIDRLDEHCRG